MDIKNTIILSYKYLLNFEYEQKYQTNIFNNKNK